MFSHEEFVAIEENPGNVAADEDKNDTDEDEGTGDFVFDRMFRPHVRKPVK